MVAIQKYVVHILVDNMGSLLRQTIKYPSEVGLLD